MTIPPEWRFRRMQPGEMNIDPIEGEFFSTEALGSLADALVREAIQNSLDARAPGMQARVRVVFPRPGAMLASERKESYFAGLWPHLGADRSGLAGLPTPDRPLDFVLIEDFGTSRTSAFATATGTCCLARSPSTGVTGDTRSCCCRGRCTSSQACTRRSPAARI